MKMAMNTCSKYLNHKASTCTESMSLILRTLRWWCLFLCRLPPSKLLNFPFSFLDAYTTSFWLFISLIFCNLELYWKSLFKNGIGWENWKGTAYIGDSPPECDDLKGIGGLTWLITEELPELEVGECFSCSRSDFDFARPRARLKEPCKKIIVTF